MKTLILLLALITCGCSVDEPANQNDTHLKEAARVKGRTDRLTGRIYVYRDKETGCEYLIYMETSRGGITPRIDKGGYRCNDTILDAR